MSMKTNSKDIIIRCSHCFKSHFPHPKFCNLVLLKQKQKDRWPKEQQKLSNDAVNLIKEKRKYLEHLKKCTECTKDILLKSILRKTNVNNVIKLKGGHKKSNIPSVLKGFKS